MALSNLSLENSETSVDFVKQRFLQLKESQASMTVTRFAALTGVSPSFLKMFFSGHRKLTVEKAFQISKVLALTPREKDLFQDLVLKDRGVKIKKTKPQASSKKFIRISDSSWLTDAYLIPITIYIIDMKLAHLLKSGPDDLADLLALKFDLPKERVGKILSSKELKKAVTEENGIQLIYDNLIHVSAQKAYLNNWLTKASTRLSGYPQSDDRFSSVTLCLTAEDRLELFAKIKTLLRDYSEKKYPEDQNLDLVQTSLQMLKLNL